MTHLIRASERSTFQRCQAQWYWKWRCGLVHKRPRYDARWFGTGVHIALAEWYCGPGTKRGPEPAETWQKFAGEALAYVKTESDDEERIAKYEDAAALGTAMLEGYRRLYGADEHISVISPEQTFRLDIPWPEQQLYDVDPGEILAIHHGTWDLAYRDLRDGKIYLGEHKTAREIQTRHLALDNQGGTYWAVATAALREQKLIGPRENLAGIVYNFLRKAMPDERPRDTQGYATNNPTKADYGRALGYEGNEPEFKKAKIEDLKSLCDRYGTVVLGERSKNQPAPLFVRHPVHRTRPERKQQLQRIQNEALQMRVVRDGLLPITKTNMRECSFCDFYDMCELQERGGDWQFFRDATYKQVDPYADHRKSASE